MKPKSFNIKIGTVCLASMSPAKDPTSAKLLQFFYNGENVQKEGGGQRLFDQCQKLQNWYFGHPLNNHYPFKSTLKRQVSFVEKMSGRLTNINYFLNGVQNMDSSQSDKNCELEVEFGYKKNVSEIGNLHKIPETN